MRWTRSTSAMASCSNGAMGTQWMRAVTSATCYLGSLALEFGWRRFIFQIHSFGALCQCISNDEELICAQGNNCRLSDSVASIRLCVGIHDSVRLSEDAIQRMPQPIILIKRVLRRVVGESHDGRQYACHSIHSKGRPPCRVRSKHNCPCRLYRTSRIIHENL